jgi:hypothetical protein
LSEFIAGKRFFVGIYAHRYGSIPPSEVKSITELEYDQATIVGVMKLIYIIKEKTLWDPTLIDKGKNAKKLMISTTYNLKKKS